MALVGLSMAFCTLLIVANLMAVKLVSIGSFVVPVAVIAYPLTFLVTDTISEIFGRKTATKIVWLGFVMNILMVILIYLGTIIPSAAFWQGQEAYETILGSVPRIVLASMVAYLASQHHDVFAFHFWRKTTKGKFLWLRNTASTMVSQGIDTVLFISIAFVGTVPNAVLLNMIFGQYLIKLIIAAVDTPFCYLLVGLIRRKGIGNNLDNTLGEAASVLD